MSKEYIEQYKKQMAENNKNVRKSTINECIKLVNAYFIEVADLLPDDATGDVVENMVLKPSKELCKRLNLMK